MALEDVLAKTPGLAGYLGRQQFDREQSLAGLQQAAAATTLATQLKASQEGAQIKAVLAESPDLQTAIPKLAALGPTGIATATHLAALEKARKSNELMSTAMQGGAGGLNDPDTIDRIAQAHFAAGDHVNAAAAMTLADKRRAALRDAAALTGMKSTAAVPAIAPDVQETTQAADSGLAAPVPSAPVPAQPGGVPEFLLKSPHVGESARSLQARINAGLEPTAEVARKRIENLETAHNTMAGRSEPAPSVHVVPNKASKTGYSYQDLRNPGISLADAPAPAAGRNPAVEQLYKDYANHPQVKEANDLESKMKPLVDYMIDFKKTGKSINANDAALAKAYLAATTSLGNRAYTMDKRELSSLPNLGDRIGNMASSFFAGKDLTDQSRTEMFNYIVQRYKALDSARAEQKSLTTRRATARGVTPEQVFGAEP